MDKTKSKKSSKQKVALVDNSDENHKKPSMKTASDVISRILWDDSLPADKFSVGYLDHFEGIMEKPFESLDWSDPAVVDNYTLALPKHRIVYFKYKNRKVWDKRTRLDMVFGSTGSPFGIYEFMSLIDQDILNFQDEDVPPLNIENDNALQDGNIDFEFDLSNRANFFIAARIADLDCVKNLKVISDYITSRDELLGQCCIKPEMYHMTLSILKLDSPSDICNAVAAMQAVASKNLPPVEIHLEGLDNFHHRVLYSRVEDNEGLMKLREALVEELSTRNVNITDKFSFVPHVTVAKLSRPVCRMRNSHFIDQYLYLKFEDDDFGVENINTLYLCEMGDARREDGFYSCACVMPLY